jgi:hypothetical protein
MSSACLNVRGALVIDNFSTGQYVPGLITGASGYVLGPGILGGERDTASYTPTVDINGSVPNHLRIFGAVPGYGGTTFLDYDGYNYSTSTFNNDGLGDVDLTQGGLNDRFRFDFTTANYAGGTLTMNVQNAGFVGSSISVPLPSSPGILDLPFAAFQTSSSHPVNFADAGWVRVQLWLNYGDSYTLGSISAVPEPAVGAVLLIGAAMGLIRKNCGALKPANSGVGDSIPFRWRDLGL